MYGIRNAVDIHFQFILPRIEAKIATILTGGLHVCHAVIEGHFLIRHLNGLKDIVALIARNIAGRVIHFYRKRRRDRTTRFIRLDGHRQIDQGR